MSTNTHGNFRHPSHYQHEGGFPPPGFYKGDPYSGDPLSETRFIDSFTTSSGGSETTRSTVRTVNFREPPNMTSREAELGTSFTQSFQVDQVVTDEVLVRHPRTLLILACIQAVVAIQIMVFGMICKIYGGCPYATALWTGGIFLLNASLGILFLKASPKRSMLIGYLLLNVVCVILSIVLFVITTSLLDEEDSKLRTEGWDYIKEHLFHLNRIVENTKIAMYSLHLVLAPIHALCCGVSAVLLCLNVKSMKEGGVSKGYFFSDATMGHQKVLVPIELKHVRQMPQTQEEEPQRQPRAVSIGVQTNANL